MVIVTALITNKPEKVEVAAVNVSHIHIKEMQFIWPDINMPILDADISLTNLNQLDSALIESTDGKLKADITPQADADLITLNADK